MMEFLTGMLENSSFPILTAFILGLMTAISPCPLATNITAIGFISKDIESQRKVFVNGLVYTLGGQFHIQQLVYFSFLEQVSSSLQDSFRSGAKNFRSAFNHYWSVYVWYFKAKNPGIGSLTEKMEHKSNSGFWGVLLLGVVFALAFCPYSGVLYFGMLMPMTISSSSGLYLPLFFAIATGIPVIIFRMAYCV